MFCGCEMYFFVVDGCIVDVFFADDLYCECTCYGVFGFWKCYFMDCGCTIFISFYGLWLFPSIFFSMHVDRGVIIF